MARKLDKDLRKLSTLEEGVRSLGQPVIRLGLGLLFMAFVGLAANALVGFDRTWGLVVIAAVVSAYMALNIGANDVANNMSPAVGSRTLTITTAVLVAAVCEAAGAVIAGGEVVSTISSRIIDPAAMPDRGSFVTAMIAALFAAALWINLATWIGAPVSTTHSVVGGVLGAGVALAGFGAADWSLMLRIVASWIVSPLMGGIVAALFLAYIKITVLDAPDKLEAARRRVPWLVAIMAGAFCTYLMLKGLNRIWPVPLWAAFALGLGAAVACYMVVRPRIARQLSEGRRGDISVGDFFTIPVICGAGLLSFAHGSNDVANAIGPLAAIYGAVEAANFAEPGLMPQWVVLVGAFGISVGLLLYGPRLIRTVGSKITKLNRIRAFCITLSAAITVILASALGLPVSSTHIAIGALFGVGFLREFVVNRANGQNDERKRRKEAGEKREDDPDLVAARNRRRYLVRRSHILTIVAAWLITVPTAGVIAAGLAWLIAASGLVVIG